MNNAINTIHRGNSPIELSCDLKNNIYGHSLHDLWSDPKPQNIFCKRRCLDYHIILQNTSMQCCVVGDVKDDYRGETDFAIHCRVIKTCLSVTNDSWKHIDDGQISCCTLCNMNLRELSTMCLLDLQFENCFRWAAKNFILVQKVTFYPPHTQYNYNLLLPLKILKNNQIFFYCKVVNSFAKDKYKNFFFSKQVRKFISKHKW